MFHVSFLRLVSWKVTEALHHGLRSRRTDLGPTTLSQREAVLAELDDEWLVEELSTFWQGFLLMVGQRNVLA
jgi:hypothetical protein